MQTEKKTVKFKSEYPPFSSWKWRNYDGTKDISLLDFIKQHDNHIFFIGTDSQNYVKGNKCTFTTVLVAYKLRHGGSVITHTDKVSCIKALRQRLLLEAMRSLETAWYLNSYIPKDQQITIHLDVNSNLKYESSRYKEELVGLVVAQGFKCLVKPDSFAASSVADRKC